jgi:hypothetical protein
LTPDQRADLRDEYLGQYDTDQRPFVRSRIDEQIETLDTIMRQAAEAGLPRQVIDETVKKHRQRHDDPAMPLSALVEDAAGDLAARAAFQNSDRIVVPVAHVEQFREFAQTAVDDIAFDPRSDLIEIAALRAKAVLESRGRTPTWSRHQAELAVSLYNEHGETLKQWVRFDADENDFEALFDDDAFKALRQSRGTRRP